MRLVKTAVGLVVSLVLVGVAPAVSAANEKPNILLILVDDLRPELASFGVSHIRSPNIDRLASAGRIFRHHYVQAPTCGASRIPGAGCTAWRMDPPIAHPAKPVGRTTWHPSEEFRQYNLWGRDPNSDADFALAVRKHYAACVSYADAQVGRLMDRLGKVGAAENTIVILWGDHGWHLGEHAIWGKHSLFEESLRSPLIVAYPGIQKPGVPSDSIVETIDVFPTLCAMNRIAAGFGAA